MTNFDFLRFFGNNSNTSSKKRVAKQRRGRTCRIEELEGREMLSVTPFSTDFYGESATLSPYTEVSGDTSADTQSDNLQAVAAANEKYESIIFERLTGSFPPGIGVELGSVTLAEDERVVPSSNSRLSFIGQGIGGASGTYITLYVHNAYGINFLDYAYRNEGIGTAYYEARGGANLLGNVLSPGKNTFFAEPGPNTSITSMSSGLSLYTYLLPEPDAPEDEDAAPIPPSSAGLKHLSDWAYGNHKVGDMTTVALENGRTMAVTVTKVFSGITSVYDSMNAYILSRYTALA